MIIQLDSIFKQYFIQYTRWHIFDSSILQFCIILAMVVVGVFSVYRSFNNSEVATAFATCQHIIDPITLGHSGNCLYKARVSA